MVGFSVLTSIDASGYYRRSVTKPTPDDDSSVRAGVIAGTAAYTLWGLFPLVFHRLGGVGAVEILLHRILWSLLVVLVVLAWRGPRGWLRPLLADRRQMARLAIAAVLIAANWLVYIWAVNHNHVVEAALGYYVNPLLTVALGVVVLHERLRRLQVVALGFGAASVAVLTVGFGHLPWIALVLATTFAGYGFQKNGVTIGSAPSLAVETAVLAPFAFIALVAAEIQGRAAFGHGSIGRDLGLAVVGGSHRGAAAAVRLGGTAHPAHDAGLAAVPDPHRAAAVRRVGAGRTATARTSGRLRAGLDRTADLGGRRHRQPAPGRRRGRGAGSDPGTSLS